MKDRFGFDWTQIRGTQFWRRPQIERRMFFRHLASAVSGYFLLPGRPTETVARAAVAPKATAKNCIFILMLGGPSHIDTFDFKDGPWMPASFDPANFGDIRFPRGLMPTLAQQLDSIAVVRSMRAWALVHGLAQTWVQIGRNPASGLAKIAPHIGSVVSMELSRQNSDRTLPAFVALNTGVGAGPGYFPPENAPFYISPSGGGLANTSHRDGASRFDTRYGLLEDIDSEARSSVETPASEIASFSRAGRRLVYNGDIDRVFTFDQNEKNRYGNSSFGNACIAARNLLRARLGARFVQITQGNWDQHSDIYAPANSHMTLAKVFDSGLATLIADLKSDGSLNDTLIVALGEFGRVPGPLNAQKGRDHFLQQSVLFAGGGVQGGRILGATDKEGKFTADPGWSRQRDIKPEDIEATIYSALGIDWTTVRRDDPLGRGFEYVPFSDRDLYGPVNELWG